MEVDIFNINDSLEFKKATLEIYHHQAVHCKVYKDFHKHLNVNHEKISELKNIPFLPIEFFKSHIVLSTEQKEDNVLFTSSGTTGEITSKHYISDIRLYEQSFMQGFSHFYGNIEEYCILALLPNYYERTGSSLVYMTNYLIEKSNNPNSGFYLYNHNELHQKIMQLESQKQKTILIGVSYALIDFLDKHHYQLTHTIVMETGGMKGKRKELLKSELHQLLKTGFGLNKIHSEYGMTELLSQAYSVGDGIYKCPKWMKVLIRDVNDPFLILEHDYTGGINIIDLANYHSCSFIATQDLGKLLKDNSFEILGRFDNSDIRGCNLLVG